ncbi:MAG TPA: TIGR02680 family protein [Actinomycetales bacterium]|nr:TIGR02680 family protein [Actinomycetales bacterium]
MTATRWQPVRAGLVDLFYYDAEEFAFRDGHLLLRGNNGTGKSKVLALLLPFLLEGNTASHRVEPDGDPGKRMEWNLLLGGRHPHSERTGYAWCEFGRRDAAGQQHRLTIGAGLKAVTGRTGVTSWFFVTDQGVGDDLHLVGPDRRVLTRERLSEAIGERGTVHREAERYRRAVNEALFDLSPDRYDALVTLLVQLRQPSLSKRPDERRLSAALTEALPPLDDAVVVDVADAFRSLEEERLALAAHREARDAAAAFATTYGAYARIASRRRAAEPRTAQSRYEETGRRLTAARDALTRAREDEQRATAAQQDVERSRVVAAEHERVLISSPEMRSAEDLRRAEQDVVDAGGRATVARAEAETATDDVARQTKRTASATRRHDDAVEAAGGLGADAQRQASQARVPTADLHEPDRGQVERDVDTTLRAVEQLRQLVDRADRRRVEHTDAQRRREESAQAADAAVEQLSQARAQVAASGEALVSAARGWLDGATALRSVVPGAVGPEDPVEALGGWVETLAGRYPLAAFAETAGRAAADLLGRRDAGLQAGERALGVQRAVIVEERAELEAGVDVVPDPSPTRDHPSRRDRAGAPLWRLVDFADDTDPAARAGVEAALEAAGLLDAWVTPTGELLDADDAVVATAVPVERNLGTTLRVAVDRGDTQSAAVPDDVVGAVLSGIGLGPGDAPTWVSTDGRYRVGSLTGRWRKDEARYIGAGTRERTRRDRLAELAAELESVDARLTTVAGDRAAVAVQLAAVEAELAAVPDDGHLRGAHATVSERVTLRARAAERLTRDETAEAAAREQLTAAETERNRAAAERGLPGERDALDAVARALEDYRRTLAQLWPALSARDAAGAALAEAEEDLGRARHELGRRREVTGEVAAVEHRAAAHRDGLRSTVGAAVADLERRLAEVQAELDRLSRATEELTQRRLDLARAVGDAEGREQELAEQLQRVTDTRAGATERLRAFARTGLLAAAVPDLEIPDPDSEWAPTPTVVLARSVEAALADVREDDDAWQRATRQVTEGLAGLGEVLSRSGNAVSHIPGDDGVVVTTSFRNRDLSVGQLTAALNDELTERERVLSAHERTVLENHLVDEVAARLAELIRGAEAQVERMNTELSQRPTSTGMRLRFEWTPADDGPAGLAEARGRLLRQTSDAWSEPDREAVGDFLQAQIAAVRARDEGGTWSEHLSAALDYRAWHRFAVQRYAEGRWRPASGPASGGERVLAATIPLFAAAASHYASAGNPHAPRLVLLDEAFAGVDDDSRAKCLGLLSEFDLDYVLTSEREWGCYPTVPGLAIAHLSRRDGIDAVLVSRWEWDGTRRTRADEPTRAVAARASPADDGLFA